MDMSRAAPGSLARHPIAAAAAAAAASDECHAAFLHNVRKCAVTDAACCRYAGVHMGPVQQQQQHQNLMTHTAH